MKNIDCRGLDCPEPVLRTKKALTDNPDCELSVTVDNETARENVLRFIKSQGRLADWQQEGAEFIISIEGNMEGNEATEKNGNISGQSQRKELPVLFISTDKLGQGSSELGQMLMRNFIYTLTQRDQLPGSLVFMNSGVKLTIESSAVIDELKVLEEKEVQVLVCGTCLDYYQLKEKHKVGLVSNMYDISDLLLEADRVITV
ncbi:MAG: sulfurtransferase-like selenium metabolism protein YedF [Bacillota bacterium]